MKRMGRLLTTIVVGWAVSLHAATWQTDDFKVTISDLGKVIGLFDELNSVNYAAKGQPSPLLQARIELEGRFRPRMR